MQLRAHSSATACNLPSGEDQLPLAGLRPHVNVPCGSANRTCATTPAGPRISTTWAVPLGRAMSTIAVTENRKAAG